MTPADVILANPTTPRTPGHYSLPKTFNTVSHTTPFSQHSLNSRSFATPEIGGGANDLAAGLPLKLLQDEVVVVAAPRPPLPPPPPFDRRLFTSARLEPMLSLWRFASLVSFLAASSADTSGAVAGGIAGGGGGGGGSGGGGAGVRPAGGAEI